MMPDKDQLVSALATSEKERCVPNVHVMGDDLDILFQIQSVPAVMRWVCHVIARPTDGPVDLNFQKGVNLRDDIVWDGELGDGCHLLAFSEEFQAGCCTTQAVAIEKLPC